MSSREFIDNIENNNNLEAEAHFTNIMIDKVGSSLEERRYDLANDLVNEKKEMKGTRAITGDEGEDIFGRDKATMGERDAIFKKYGFSVPKDVLDAQKKREQERRDRRNAPKSKPKDADPNRSDAKAKRKGDLPKRTGDGGVAADMEIAGGKAPSKSNQELDIGAGPKKPSKKPQVGTGDQHGRSKTKKPKVVQPGDTKHPLDTSDIESGATGGQPKKSKADAEWETIKPSAAGGWRPIGGPKKPSKKPGMSPGALGGRSKPSKKPMKGTRAITGDDNRVFDFE